MFDYIMSYDFTSYMVIFTYWMPLLINIVVYSFKCVDDYRRDLAQCNDEFYAPILTIATIVLRILASIVPIINLLALVFDTLSSFTKWVINSLNIPLVKGRYTEDK